MLFEEILVNLVLFADRTDIADSRSGRFLHHITHLTGQENLSFSRHDIHLDLKRIPAGEITLRGRVLPIGGLKEKLLAAKNAGIKVVLIPKENVSDVEELSHEITRGLKIVPVSRMRRCGRRISGSSRH